MPAGNWYSTLPIAGSGFVEWPFGPLVPVAGEIVVRVEAWLMQQATGAMQMTFQDNPPDPNGWVADKIWYPRKKAPSGTGFVWDGTGRFKPGAALGTAVAIATTKTGGQTYFWWTQEVQLI